jgi:hypothetical protein
MMKLRAEINGKVYDTETAEIVKAGWKAGTFPVLAVRFAQDETSKVRYFTVELGSRSAYLVTPIDPDTSRITLIPEDADWELIEDKANVTKQLRAYFGRG